MCTMILPSCVEPNIRKLLRLEQLGCAVCRFLLPHGLDNVADAFLWRLQYGHFCGGLLAFSGLWCVRMM